MTDAAERCLKCNIRPMRSGSKRYCARCATWHRDYQRERMRAKRQGNKKFRKAENAKQRARMRKLRASRRAGAQ